MFNYLLMLGLLLISLAVSAASDPTKPFSTSQSSALPENKLVLQSIIRGDNVNTAIINGKAMKLGVMIGNYQVTKINDDNVVLRDDSEEIKLHLYSSSFKVQSVSGN